jgi:YD repeat-containing protein
VTEANIYDLAGNRNRTTMSYTAFTLPSGASCSLPSDAYQYAADAATVLRRSHTDYNLSSTYLDRRIIGLAASQTLFDGANNLMARTDLQYDEAGSIQNQAATAQHDDTNYGSGLVAGRANVSSARRYNVINSGQWTVSSVQYNTAGAVVTAIDPAGHQSTIGYTDSFSDSVNRNTFAYPTTVTDADGNSFYFQYNYDFGARTRVQGPPPAGQSQGAIQTFAFDSAGRLLQVNTTNNGAYTRYVYGWNYLQSFSTVNNLADEAYSIQIFDGVGRTVLAGGNHPGSVGGYRGVWTQYDLMGRVLRQSNPTEINAGWITYGDDAAGWVFSVPPVYDWKGRALKIYNQDGTYKTADYAGCGCAGGEVVTLTDEVGRQQKVYSDVLGRTAKTEMLNWNGSVYSTTANSYNARDQVTLVRQYQGADTSGVYQDTTVTYDGYGRLVSKHVPEQNAGTSTVYAYNNDDTISSVTDARGASATYAYNNRHLVTGLTYSAPAGIAPTSNVSFGYDAAGNRTSMADGLGSQSYSYNDLSRLMSEARTFTNVGTFMLSYDYNLAGELRKITDATNMTIDYGFDTAGLLSSVTGADNLFMGISNYASNFQYRAWGGLKAMTDGSNHTSSLLYNSKLQPTHFDLNGNIQNYDYSNDGRISFVHNTAEPNFDRSYAYDHVARLAEAKTGGQVRGDVGASPYYETFSYDVWSNLNGRQTNNWDQDWMFDGATYTNDRRSGWGYDPDGRNTTIGTRTYNFDADGQMTLMTGQKWVLNHYVNVSQMMGYDGDGDKIQEVANGQATYYLRSSMLDDAIVTEVNSSGQKNVEYVFSPDGGLLATQVVASQNSYIA